MGDKRNEGQNLCRRNSKRGLCVGAMVTFQWVLLEIDFYRISFTVRLQWVFSRQATVLLLSTCSKATVLLLSTCSQATVLLLSACSQATVLLLSACSQATVLLLCTCSQARVLLLSTCSQARVLLLSTCSQATVLLLSTCSQATVLLLSTCSQELLSGTSLLLYRQWGDCHFSPDRLPYECSCFLRQMGSKRR
jgi:hypothetical protein